MKLLKAIAILIFGPLLCSVVAFIVVGLAWPPDPKFAANGGHGAPGDGFLILLCLFVSLVVSVPASVAGALWVLFHKPKRPIETS